MDWDQGPGLMGQTGVCGPGHGNEERRATGWALGTAVQDVATGHLLISIVQGVGRLSTLFANANAKSVPKILIFKVQMG